MAPSIEVDLHHFRRRRDIRFRRRALGNLILEQAEKRTLSRAPRPEHADRDRRLEVFEQQEIGERRRVAAGIEQVGLGSIISECMGFAGGAARQAYLPHLVYYRAPGIQVIAES